MKRTDLLKNWVQLQHRDQLIRSTSAPYFDHLVFVADTVKNRTRLGYEIGLCHDLLEKTKVTVSGLRGTLICFGYSEPDADYIIYCVIELTNIFTKRNYPDLSKAERKAKETDRLVTISFGAQTVKYADLIYNIGWVLKYDRNKASRYLHKKQLLLVAMAEGDQQLRLQAIAAIEQGLSGLLII